MPARTRGSARAALFARLALLAPFAWLAACGGQAAGEAKVAPKPFRVTLVPTATLRLDERIAVTGTLAPQEELELGFAVRGRLAALSVDVGDEVKPGDPLAALDPVDFDLEIARAEAALVVARARLSLGVDSEPKDFDVEATAPVREAKAVLVEAELARERQRELVQKELGAQQALDSATAAVSVAQSRLQAARDQVATWLAEYAARRVDVELAHKQKRDSSLRAPWPGRVAMRRSGEGSWVAAGEAVLRLLRTDPLRLRLRVPERQSARVSRGQVVHFTVDGGGDTVHTGTVQREAPSIDSVDRTLLVEAVVENGNGVLRAGGFCRAQIVVGPAAPVLAVPKASVASFAGVDRVYVVDGGKAKDLLVQLGRSEGDLVEVRSGLVEGARVVADPKGLVPGALVEVAE